MTVMSGTPSWGREPENKINKFSIKLYLVNVPTQLKNLCLMTSKCGIKYPKIRATTLKKPIPCRDKKNSSKK